MKELLLVALKLADWLTTWVGMSIGCIEANPLGVTGAVIVGCVAIAITIPFHAWLCKNQMKKEGVVLFVGVAIMFTIPAVNNSIVLFML